MSNPTPPPLLEAHDLHKSYTLGRRSLEVLRGLHLHIQHGDFVAVRGASGAGKSTLLHLLGGLDLPSRGHIRVEGQNLTTLSSLDLARFRNRRIGFVFQSYHLLPELSALENVCLPARMARIPAREAIRRAHTLLQRVGLSERLDHRPYELSGGEQQRVALARALVNQPDLLLADEPTGNLDSHTGAEIIDLLCALRQEHHTALVIATHDGHVAQRAPRVIELADGVIAPE